MQDKPADSATKPRFITDRELAPLIGVSAATLQRDRRTRKSIPFVRIGDRCLYDPEEVFAALKRSMIGGAVRTRGRA